MWTNVEVLRAGTAACVETETTNTHARAAEDSREPTARQARPLQVTPLWRLN